MRKSKKFIAVVLALIIALSTLAVGASTITVSAASVAPVSLKSTAYNSNATVTIGWQKGSGGATGYQIAKKKLGDKSYTYIYVGGGNTQSYNDKSVVCGTIYYYQVRTVNKVGKTASYSSWSNCKTITTLYRPTVTSLNYLNNNMLNINWNKIKGVSHYKLAFKRTTDKAWNYREVKNTYYNVNNPTVGATYTIQVCPMNGSIAGQWSLVNSIIIVVKVSSVKLSQTSLSLELGQTKKLTATVAPSNAKNKTLQWSSSNTAVATVDQSGKVTSVAKGAATIYAKATDGSGKQGTCAVTVTGIKVSSITLAPTSVSLKPGQTTTLTATVSPANAETKAIQWTSSKTSVATVDKNGNVTAVKDGTATIYAKATDGSGKQATCTVTVAGIKVTSITLAPTSVSMKPGETKELSATVSPADAYNKTIQWLTSNSSVATVDQSGKVKAVKDGTATIYAKATDGSGKQGTCSVTVAGIKITSITLTPATVSIVKGGSTTLSTSISPTDASNKTLQWSSSNTSVATVNQNGKVTAASKGTAKIYAKATDGSGVQALCNVSVIESDAQYIANFNKLVSYIKNNPDGIDGSGNAYINFNFSSGEDCRITALPSGKLKFYDKIQRVQVGITYTTTVSFEADFNSSFLININFSYLASDPLINFNKGCNGTALIDARNYSDNTKLSFNSLTSNENNTANTYTRLAFISWNIALMEKPNLKLKLNDIGFKSYS